MRLTNILFLVGSSLLAINSMAQEPVKLKTIKWISTEIPEPSDICYHASTNTFYVVSDNGILFETDANGKIIRQTKQANTDFEAVYADDQFIYAVDETHRDIYAYNTSDLKKVHIANVPYSGGRNKGFEAFTFNKSKNNFVIITERDPIMLYELDTNFKISNQIDLSNIARDIASACYHDSALWLLSDEDMMLIKLNPLTYEVLQKWSLPVINPEGFAFDKDGNVIIASDDMQRIYYFNNPEKP